MVLKCARPRTTPVAVAGFSLIEILLAFTLLALALGILMQIFSRGVNNAALADRYARATMMAESKLAGVGADEPLVEGEKRGNFDDDFSWTLSIKPYVDTNPAPAASGVGAASPVDVEALMAVRLFEVAVTVSFGSDDQRTRNVTLNTLLIGPKA